MKKRVLEIEHILLKLLLPIAISISALTFLFTVLAGSGFILWVGNGGLISWLQFSAVVWIELLVAAKLLQERTSQVEAPPSTDLDTISATHSQTATEKEIDNHPLLSSAFISKPKTFFFKYCYLIFVIVYAVDTLQILLSSLFAGHVRLIRYDLTFVSLRQLQLVVAGTGVILWAFHVWRAQLPKILASMYKHKRLKGHDVDKRFLEFLNEFQDAQRKPIINLIPISLIAIYALYYYYDVWLPGLNFYIHNNAGNITFVVSFSIHLACIAFIIFGCMCCLGLISSMLFVAGRFISILAQRFEFNIEPLHPDRCGGLGVLGNFCFSAASPIFIGSAFFIGYIFLSVRDPRGGFDLLTVDLILFIILAYGLFVSIFVLFLPLWHIHLTMLREREADNEGYAAIVEDLRLEIQKLLKDNNTDEAKHVKEKMDLMQAIHASYPRWPFNVGVRFLSSFLAIASSLLLGFLTAFMQPLVQALLHFVGYKP